ncbi:hypothetical protein [Gemmobacter denitrificans]|uniref:PH (Pleckstrin Homology) domain-containing protein n=1 Tax=Gemmobacter denitrificans TaxID=3123040 RepID=A0ABU8BWR0_9RHOB
MSDGLIRGPAPLAEGEELRATFAPDRTTYLRRVLILIVLFGALAGAILLALGNPYPWTGPVAALLGVGVRGWYLASEALAATWRLTDRRLLGPAGQVVPLSSIDRVQTVFGDVLVITRAGDKHLLKYLPDAPAVIARLQEARA